MPNFDKIESMRMAIARSAPPTMTLHIGGGLRFERSYDRLTWIRTGTDAPFTAGDGAAHGREYDRLWPLPGHRLVIPEAGGSFTVEFAAYSGEAIKVSGRYEAAFDANLLNWPLSVRSRRNGDRFEPSGVIGSKKVKDMFIDYKIEPSRRDRIPLLADSDGRILWIPGIRRSRHAMVSALTTRIALLRFEPQT